MFDLKNYNVGIAGISGFITQVDTPLTLANWFESDEDRQYVIKYSDYCAYSGTYGRDGYNLTPFTRAHKILEKLTMNDLTIDKKDVNEVITSTYCALLRDVGILLLKEAGLYCRDDSNWKPFDIAISIPLVLKNYFGTLECVTFEGAKGRTEMVDIGNMLTFDELIKESVVLDVLMNREDISLQDILSTKGTPIENLVVKGITYLLLSKENIKGRVVGD